MTEIQQALAMEDEIVEGGVTYRVGGITAEVISRWESELATETYELLLKVSGNQAAALETVGRMSVEGVFDFIGESSWKKIGTLEGRKKLMYLRVRQHHKTIDPKVIYNIVENNWAELAKIELKERAAESARPNEQAPTGANQSVSGGSQSSPDSVTATNVPPAMNASAA